MKCIDKTSKIRKKISKEKPKINECIEIIGNIGRSKEEGKKIFQ